LDTLRFTFLLYDTGPAYCCYNRKVKLKYELIEPANPGLPDTVITMGNTLGNSIEGNARDKARFVSTLLNMRVCVYQRPGTGSDKALRSHQADAFIGQHTRAAAEYLDEALGQEGVGNIIVASHSADGPFGMGLVLAKRLPVVAFAASDPVGVRDVRTRGGFRRWAAYRSIQSQPGHPSPQTPPEWKAPPEVSNPNLAKDMFLNHRVWREARVANGLAHVARYMPYVAVNVVFPQHTFNGDPDFMQETAAQLQRHADRRPEGGMPFTVAYEPGRAHRFYDDPRYFGGIIVDTLVSLGHQPETFVHEMYADPTFRHAGAVET
jgi:pimeloyl-ACP methyl ester carboxylesterase